MTTSEPTGGYHCPHPGCRFRAVARVLLDDHLRIDHQEQTR